MKVTKYPHRYTISLSAVEFAALRFVLDHGLADFAGDDIGQLYGVPSSDKRVIKSERWQQQGGPLSVDTVKSGRGGYAGVGEA